MESSSPLVNRNSYADLFDPYRIPLSPTSIKAVRVFAGLLLTAGVVGIVGVGLIAFQVAPPFIAVAFATLKLTANTALIGIVILKVSGISLALLFKEEKSNIPEAPPLDDANPQPPSFNNSDSSKGPPRTYEKKPNITNLVREEDLKQQMPSNADIQAQLAAMKAKKRKKEEEAEVERKKNQEGDSKAGQEQQSNHSGSAQQNPANNLASSESQPVPWTHVKLKPSKPDEQISRENSSNFSEASSGLVFQLPKKVGQASAQQQAPQKTLNALEIRLQQQQEKIKKQEEEKQAKEQAAVAKRQVEAEEQARQEQERRVREAEEKQQAEEKMKEEARKLAEKTAEDKRKKEEQEAARRAAEEQRNKAQLAQLQGAPQAPVPPPSKSKIISEKMRRLQTTLLQAQDQSNSAPSAPSLVVSSALANQSLGSPASLLGDDGIPEAPPLPPPGSFSEADPKLKSTLKEPDKLSPEKHVRFSVPWSQPSASSPVSQPEPPSEDALEGDAKTRAEAQLPPESFVTPKKSLLKKQLEELEAIENAKEMFQNGKKKKKGGLTESVYGKLKEKFHGKGAGDAAQSDEESDEEVSDLSGDEID